MDNLVEVDAFPARGMGNEVWLNNCLPIQIHCPYCGQCHHHGFGDGPRVSHCTPNVDSKTYVIKGCDRLLVVAIAEFLFHLRDESYYDVPREVKRHASTLVNLIKNFQSENIFLKEAKNKLEKMLA